MTQLTDKEINQLIETAKISRKNAFLHRSKHKVGAAVLSTDGHIFGGCNTESVIFGLGTCAERSAIDHAVAHGKYQYKAIAVIDKGKTYPCGACLQYLTLFYQISNQEIKIIISDLEGNYEIKNLTELLPHPYLTKNNLKITKKYKNKEYAG